MQPFQQKPSFIGHSPYEQVIPGLRSSSSVEALLQHILYTYKYIVHHNSPTSTNAEPLKLCLPWWRGTSSCGADKTQVCKWGGDAAQWEEIDQVEGAVEYTVTI